MPQISSFFELAALLIPILLLSGYATQHVKPPGALQLSVLRGTALRELAITFVIVVLFGIFPAFAELVALTATMNGGRAGNFETWVVASAVALGMWSVAGAIVWPWVRHLWTASRGIRALVCVTATAALLMTGYGLRTGVANQQSLISLEQSRITFASLLDQSQAQEAVLRDTLHLLRAKGITSGKLHADIERQISKLLADRIELIESKRFAEDSLSG